MTTREIIERLKVIQHVAWAPYDRGGNPDRCCKALDKLITELESTYVETSSGPVIAAEWTKGSKGCGD